MNILIIENVTPPDRGGNEERWREEAQHAYGIAALEEFDVIIGIDEHGHYPVIQDRTGEVGEVDGAMT